MEINSDDLGEKGESRFKEFCADAGLICNKSDRDRTGWDFIVEFKYDDEENLDARPAPISAHFQVKAVRHATDRVALRLSSAERLAKDPKPSFIYVFAVNDDLSFRSAHILHLMDEPLGRILKRLREERASTDRKPVNQQAITFAIASMHELPLTGAALRAALTSLCSDMPGYIAEKRKQLDQIGFGENRFEATTTLRVPSMDHLVDGLLGLNPIEVVQFKPSETRFGITLPMRDQEAASGTMRVSPVPMDYCAITARETPLAPPVNFRAPVFTTPKAIPQQFAKLLIRHKLFEFHSTATSQRFSFQEEKVSAARCTIKEWVDFLRFQVMLFTETGTLSITPDRGKRINLRLRFQEKIDPKPFNSALELFKMAEEIFKIAGIANRDFAFDDIASSHAHIRLVASFVRGEELSGILRVEGEKPDTSAIPARASGLYINQFDIAGVTLGFCANVEMFCVEEGHAIQWRSSDTSVISVDPLENEDAYEEFCERMKTENPAEIVMIGAKDAQSDFIVDSSDA